ncbi:acyl-CoA thioesterase [Neobittarella massiliensis]|uniref:Acyl-CoA thioesterase n=1 Tax=Neobittarella massiliensis (ex Bilen et al. 2018) TaxID=2041842 RepID=A0A8J6M1G4_9FIRM|nr:acyl-CoA thioesterase [Neobittarella massiliensis]MBC3516256.1 acyl-CoA thioesterase [Neobittarella massiliensis]
MSPQTPSTPAVAQKPARLSYTEQTCIVMASHINGSGRLFGGTLMQWIDVIAAVAGRRHSGCDVTTASVDNLQFHRAAVQNDTVLLTAKVTYTGRTSMEVRVDSFVESLAGDRQRINTAYLVLVALDKQGRPTPVPALLCETTEEQAEFQAALRRDSLRRQRRKEEY